MSAEIETLVGASVRDPQFSLRTISVSGRRQEPEEELFNSADMEAPDGQFLSALKISDQKSDNLVNGFRIALR
jgi:hypothetical protein